MTLLDNFDKLRESIWGLPGFITRKSTIVAPPWLFVPQSTWIVESVKTTEGQAIMLQSISAEGANRIYLPSAVCEAIYRQHDAIIKEACKQRAKNAALTRKNKQAEPPSENPYLLHGAELERTESRILAGGRY